MTAAPQNIRALQEEGVLEICWSEPDIVKIPYKALRCSCPCAGCVNEFTGQIMLDPDTIPEDIKLTNVSFTGNYALKISWDGGHDTGLYTWERLKSICDAIR